MDEENFRNPAPFPDSLDEWIDNGRGFEQEGKMGKKKNVVSNEPPELKLFGDGSQALKGEIPYLKQMYPLPKRVSTN